MVARGTAVGLDVDTTQQSIGQACTLSTRKEKEVILDFMDVGEDEVVYDPEMPEVRDKPDIPTALHTSYLTDPCKFSKLVWPELTLYPKQQEILYSVRDNIQTFVHAGNELGKDFISGLCVPWFFMSRRPCRIVTSSAGETQLKSVLWGEIAERLYTARFKFPFRVTHLNIKQLGRDGAEVPLSYCLGHVTKSVENFQGHHLDHDIPRVLGLFDEASGIADQYWEAAQSWLHRALVIGNPLNTTNFFYRECKGGDVIDPAAPPGSKRLLRKVIHIGAEHSPNVQVGKELAARGYKGEKGWPTVIPGVLSYPEYLRRKVQWDKIKQSMRLYGHFYEGESELLYPPAWLDLGEEVYKAYHPDGYDFDKCTKTRDGFRKAKAMGIDGGAGRDLTVFTIVDEIGIIMQHSLPTPNTMKICSLAQLYMQNFKIPPSMVTIDVGGGGKQIADRLKELGIKIRAIAFGGTATPPKEVKTRRKAAKVEVEEVRMTYKNRRCEMYGLLRDQFDPNLNPAGFAIPEEMFELRQELSVHPLWYDSDGKMYLPAKSVQPHRKNKETDEITIKKMLNGRSPDRADSLVLANFAMVKPIQKRRIGARG